MDSFKACKLTCGHRLGSAYQILNGKSGQQYATRSICSRSHHQSPARVVVLTKPLLENRLERYCRLSQVFNTEDKSRM